ncbi:hypothetical protein CS063_14290 [Sporanaerobium hydrogeniformans]|uniref:Uncharacterized protein n=1 Tax=Sporanaerobium hydrogeniformans TaxID=3072179 RepID=A0AC61DAH4_9FIRM|nr:sensor histidine kinase [Sporanaerobium hydrogeniformans]PHV69760.1 hypothetical protein CS063_14290 [Sporanaerobium hydrogeniformans]
MKKKSLGDLAILWLKDHIKSIVLYLVLMFLYCMVAALSRIPMEPILYSTYVFSFVGIMVCLWDYQKYIKKYYALLNVYENRTISLEQLPLPQSFIEGTYQEILKALYANQQTAKMQLGEQKTEMTNYYTLWAHQIKTPIAAMKLLLEHKEEQNGYMLETELFKIEQYVEMVLQYLRLESISADLVLKPYALQDIVRQAVKKYAISFIGKKLTLHLQPFEAIVLTDEKWISFVIEQILSNSLKYTQTGSITISIEETDKEIKLMIKDTGIGISPEDLPRIGERGFTGYNGRMDKKSTGIGLYLCKQVTTRLSHSLEVTSTVGQGTIVTLGFLKNKKL